MSKYPFYVVMLVTADIKTAADTFLYRHGYGTDNFNRALILIADPDDAAAKGYATMVQADRPFRTLVMKRAKQLAPKAFCFWSMNRREAKQEALAFITAKGYRLKPTA